MFKNYEICYADPPWQYKAWSKKGQGRNAESHYPTMTIEDICTLPVSSITAENCILFMWVTFPVLPDAFRVIEAWEFSYKTVAFTWCKRNRKSPSWFWGMGHWTRANAEICLLATKGKPKRISGGVHQIIDTPVEQHSKKPDVTRDKILELVGDLPRIELFARQATPGWDVWGNEAPGSINLLGAEKSGKT
jgi:Transcriptional activator, adenine-specific DNA methyltransferase